MTVAELIVWMNENIQDQSVEVFTESWYTQLRSVEPVLETSYNPYRRALVL